MSHDEDDKAATVVRIIRSKTLFEVLSVSEDASPELSLKVHPDKCKHPKAEEAFKRVNEAKRILIDPRLRERYIQTGSTQDHPTPSHQHNHHGHRRPTYYNPYTGQYFYAEEDPMDDILRQFFGGASFQSQARFRQRQQQNYQRRQPRGQSEQGEEFEFDWRNVNWAPLAQLLLMLAMFILPTILSAWSMSSSTPTFSLKPTSDFPVEMITMTGRVKYYVSQDFDTSHLRTEASQAAFEASVLEAFRNQKRVECSYEQNHKTRMQMNAKTDEQRSKASAYVTKACDELSRASGAR